VCEVKAKSEPVLKDVLTTTARIRSGPGVMGTATYLVVRKEYFPKGL